MPSASSSKHPSKLSVAPKYINCLEVILFLTDPNFYYYYISCPILQIALKDQFQTGGTH